MHIRDGTKVKILRHHEAVWVNYEGYAYWSGSSQGGEGWTDPDNRRVEMIRMYVVLPQRTSNPDKNTQPQVEETDLEEIG